MFGKFASYGFLIVFAMVAGIVLGRNTAESETAPQAAFGQAMLGRAGYVAAKSQDHLGAAREALQRGNYDEAITRYQKYINAHGDNMEARGELGNAYFRAGRKADALQAYSDAAHLLLDRGEINRAEPFIIAIGDINPARADVLFLRLDKARMKSRMPITSAHDSWPDHIPSQSAMMRK